MGSIWTPRGQSEQIYWGPFGPQVGKVCKCTGVHLNPTGQGKQKYWSPFGPYVGKVCKCTGVHLDLTWASIHYRTRDIWILHGHFAIKTPWRAWVKKHPDPDACMHGRLFTSSRIFQKNRWSRGNYITNYQEFSK